MRRCSFRNIASGKATKAPARCRTMAENAFSSSVGPRDLDDVKLNCELLGRDLGLSQQACV